MYLIGVTGVMGCGKTSVSALLVAHGARLLDSDQLAREVLAPGSDGLAIVTARFGREMVRKDGTLDREALGQRVFSDPQARQALERIVHPRIREQQRERLARWALETPEAIVVLDVPLLFETGGEVRCDLTVVVACGDAREQRVAVRSGVSAATRRGALAHQWSEAEKCRRADRVIDNRGEHAMLVAQVEALWQEVSTRGSAGTAWPSRWQD